jgi:hypothetical protein
MGNENWSSRGFGDADLANHRITQCAEGAVITGFDKDQEIDRACDGVTQTHFWVGEHTGNNLVTRITRRELHRNPGANLSIGGICELDRVALDDRIGFQPFQSLLRGAAREPDLVSESDERHPRIGSQQTDQLAVDVVKGLGHIHILSCAASTRAAFLQSSANKLLTEVTRMQPCQSMKNA